MEYEVHWMPRAARQLERVVTWWHANRPDSSLAFEEELEAAILSLRTLPSRMLGVPPSRQPERRRLLVARFGYVVIYRVRPRAYRVEVLAIVHGKQR